MSRSKTGPGGSLALVIALVVATGGVAAATTMLKRSVGELTVASEVVLVGKVESRRSEWNAAHTSIHTLTTIRVVEVIGTTPGAATAALKSGAVVEVFTRGGVVGDIGMTVMGAPEMRAGEEVLLFLDRVGPHLGVTGWAQGKWALAPPAPAGPAGTTGGDPLGARLCVPGTSGLSLVERGPDGALRPVAPHGARPLRELRAEIRAARGEP